MNLYTSIPSSSSADIVQQLDLANTIITWSGFILTAAAIITGVVLAISFWNFRKATVDAEESAEQAKNDAEKTASIQIQLEKILSDFEIRREAIGKMDNEISLLSKKVSQLNKSLAHQQTAKNSANMDEIQDEIVDLKNKLASLSALPEYSSTSYLNQSSPSTTFTLPSTNSALFYNQNPGFINATGNLSSELKLHTDNISTEPGTLHIGK